MLLNIKITMFNIEFNVDVLNIILLKNKNKNSYLTLIEKII